MIIDELISFLGRPVVIEQVGDNSEHQFISERDWACIIEFPDPTSGRAHLIKGMAEIEFDDIRHCGADNYFDVHFAFKNCPTGYWNPAKKDSVSGEPAQIKLYRKGVLVAEIDDQIFMGDLKIIDESVIDKKGKVLFDEHGNYNRDDLIDDPSGKSVKSQPQFSRLQRWVADHGIALEKTPLDRMLWEKAYRIHIDMYEP